MKYEYWIRTDKDGEPMRLFRILDGFVEVWYQGEWLPTKSTRAQFSGLGGSASVRVIPKSSEARLLPGFYKTLNGKPQPKDRYKR